MGLLIGYKRDGEWQSFGVSVKDIVIGYDLGPLIGLHKMLARLKANGTFHRLRVRRATDGETWCLFRGRTPDPKFLAWGGPYVIYSKAVRSACGFVEDEFAGDNRAEIGRCWLGHDRTWRDARRALARHGLSVHRVRIVESRRATAR